MMQNYEMKKIEEENKLKEKIRISKVSRSQNYSTIKDEIQR